MNALPNADDDRFVDRFYDDYLSFKTDWTGEPSAESAAYFDQIAPLTALQQGSDLLEIGFGDGQFLAWARQKGHHIVGGEIQPALLDRAKAQGFDVIAGPLHARSLEGRTFDCIAAFDLLEHLTLPEIQELLVTARCHLKPGGFCIFRFPNAASPFGIYFQYGDATHKTCLSVPMIGQIAYSAGLKVTDVPRPKPPATGLRRKIKRFVANRIRRLIEGLIAAAYLEKGAHLEANAVVVLRALD